MPHKVEEFLESGAFFAAVLDFAGQMLAIYHESPRIASIFASQQRWLMAHAGFALHYGYPGEPRLGLYSGRFISFVVNNKIASRNTAAAFIQEMLAYRFLRPIESLSDKRTRYLEPTETAQDHFVKWFSAHLLILDTLDGGQRLERAMADPTSFMRIQPMIAKAIVESNAVRDPGTTYNLFNWANSGGLVMDYLMSRVPPFDASSERIQIGAVSLKQIRDQFMISNTHLKRLLTQAADIGSIGWTEPPYKGTVWLSRDFIMEYWGYQAAKFAIVDAATEATLGPTAAKAASLA